MQSIEMHRVSLFPGRRIHVFLYIDATSHALSEWLDRSILALKHALNLGHLLL